MKRDSLIDGWENLPEDAWKVVDTMICIPLDGERECGCRKIEHEGRCRTHKKGELKRTRVIVNAETLWRREEKLVRNDTRRNDQPAVRGSCLTRKVFFSINCGPNPSHILHEYHIYAIHCTYCTVIYAEEVEPGVLSSVRSVYRFLCHSGLLRTTYLLHAAESFLRS